MNRFLTVVEDPRRLHAIILQPALAEAVATRCPVLSPRSLASLRERMTE